MGIIIKEIAPSQYGKCVDVIRRAFAPVADRFSLTEHGCPTNPAFVKLERLIFEADNGVDMYGVFKDDVQIGFVGLDKRENEMKLEKLCIVPEQCGNGYGTLLLEFAKDKARKMGYKKISLGVIAQNMELREWYKANGFSEMSVRSFELLPFEVCMMQMELI